MDLESAREKPRTPPFPVVDATRRRSPAGQGGATTSRRSPTGQVEATARRCSPTGQGQATARRRVAPFPYRPDLSGDVPLPPPF